MQRWPAIRKLAPLFAVFILVLCALCLVPDTGGSFAHEAFPEGGLIAASFFARLRGKNARLPDGIRERVEKRITELENYGQEELGAPEQSPSARPPKKLRPKAVSARVDIRNLAAAFQALLAAVEARDANARVLIRNGCADCRQLLEELLALVAGTRERLAALRTLLLEINEAADDREKASEEQMPETFRPYLIVNK